MAEDPNNLDREILEELKKTNQANQSRADKAKEEKEAREANRERKKLVGALGDNTAGLIGLTASMFTLKGMAGDIMGMNASLARSLGQTANASKGMKQATDRFVTGAQSTQQMVDVFADAVDMGMTGFSDASLQLGSQLKVLGVQNKTVFQLMRANTQALGLSEESTLAMSNSLVTTAAENGDSIEGLIGALNSMRDAMVKTTVELGPKAAANAQKIAAMMSQGNTELQDASARFVQSFLSGSDGFMKAAKLGVRFTGQESTAEMAAKFEQILMKMEQISGGRQGMGSQFFFDAMEKSFGLSREDFNLQQQIGTDIKELVVGRTEELAQQSASVNLQQTIANGINGMQVELINVAGHTAQGLTNIKLGANQMINGLGQWLMPIMGSVGTMVGLLGFSTVMRPFRFLAKGLDKLGGKLVNSLFGVKRAVMKTSGKAISGAAAKSAVKAGSATAVQKGLLKGLVKKIPLIGAVAGLGFGISRMIQGDFAGAGMELASGLAGTIPGVGTAASVGIDAALMARDMKGSESPVGGMESATAAPPDSGAGQMARQTELLEQIADSVGVTADVASNPTPELTPFRAGSRMAY